MSIFIMAKISDSDKNGSAKHNRIIQMQTIAVIL